MSEFVVPDAMVEAAAEVLSVDATGFFYFNGEDWREKYRDLARRSLAAALGMCEIREQWGCRYHDLHAEDGLPVDATWWPPRGVRREVEYFADSQPWGFHARVIRRLVITSPAEPVDTEGAPT